MEELPCISKGQKVEVMYVYLDPDFGPGYKYWGLFICTHITRDGTIALGDDNHVFILSKEGKVIVFYADGKERGNLAKFSIITETNRESIHDEFTRLKVDGLSCLEHIFHQDDAAGGKSLNRLIYCMDGVTDISFVKRDGKPLVEIQVIESQSSTILEKIKDVVPMKYWQFLRCWYYPKPTRVYL